MSDSNLPPNGTQAGPDSFLSTFGEPLANTLDLSTWRKVNRLSDLYEELTQEVASAQAIETNARATIRKEVFPILRSRTHAPPGAGVFSAADDDIERVQRGLLFTGAVEACNGIAVTHESLAISITQLGI